MKTEIADAILDNVVETINQDRRLFSTARLAVTEEFRGAYVFCRYGDREITPRTLRFLIFQAHWSRDYIITVRTIRCYIRLDFHFKKWDYGILLSEPRRTLPDKQEIFSILPNRITEAFPYDIYDRSGKLDEIAEWALDQASWLTIRVPFLTD